MGSAIGGRASLRILKMCCLLSAMCTMATVWACRGRWLCVGALHFFLVAWSSDLHEEHSSKVEHQSDGERSRLDGCLGALLVVSSSVDSVDACLAPQGVSSRANLKRPRCSSFVSWRTSFSGRGALSLIGELLSDGRLKVVCWLPCSCRAECSFVENWSRLGTVRWAFALRPAGCLIVTWLILPVVICLSQRLSHACLSTSLTKVKPRMAH